MDETWLKWLEKEQVELSEDDVDGYLTWLHGKPKRKYRHIDNPISIPRSHESVREQLLDNHVIGERSFYPFLKFTEKTPRYRYSSEQRKKILVNKERDIMYSAHFDSLVYSWYSSVLEHFYELFLSEAKFSQSVLAYRRLKDNTGESMSNLHFAKHAFDSIGLLGDGTVAICIDISGFFDNLNHNIVKDSIIKVLGKGNYHEGWGNVIKHLTEFGYIELDSLEKAVKTLKVSKEYFGYCTSSQFRSLIKEGLIQINKNEKSRGIPQGSPISAVVSNVYMIDFDEFAYNLIGNIGGEYYRYSDDILILLPSGSDYQDVVSMVSDFIIDKLKLEINPSKTEIIEFKEIGANFTTYDIKTGKNKPLRYLGLEYDGERVRIRNSAISKYQAQVINAIRNVTKAELRKGKRIDKIRYTGLRRKYTTHYYHNPHKIRSFIGYVYRAYEVFGDKAILDQISRHVDFFNSTIKREQSKLSK